MYTDLRRRIKEVCGSETNFAEKMGVTKSNISQKMHGKRRWDWEQIVKASEVLGLSPTETLDLFKGESNEETV